MASILIHYKASQDIFPLLDPAYQALFPTGYFHDGEGVLRLINGVYVIPAKCFENVDKLTSIDIPKQIYSFGQNAFTGTSLTYMTLSEDFRSCNKDALKGLTINSLECLAKEVPEISSQEDLQIVEMTVPKHLLEAYKNSDWNNYVLVWKVFEECIHDGTGFNICEMIDTNYIRQD